MQSPAILIERESLRGILQSIKPAGPNFVAVTIGIEKTLLPAKLRPKLEKLLGQNIAVAKVGNDCRVGQYKPISEFF